MQNSRLTRTFARGTRLAALSLVSALLIAGPVNAQSGQPAPGAQQSKGSSMKELQTQARDLAKKLGQIREEAVQSDDALKARHEDFRKQLTAAMKEKGYTPEKDYQRMVEIRKEIQSADLDKEQRMELVKEFQKKQVELQQAQREAMQDEDLKEKRESLSQATVAAMKDRNPETENLMAEFDQVRQQLQQQRAAVKKKMIERMRQRKAQQGNQQQQQ